MLAHQYRKTDFTIVVDVVTTRLVDIEAFLQRLQEQYGLPQTI